MYIFVWRKNDYLIEIKTSSEDWGEKRDDGWGEHQAWGPGYGDQDVNVDVDVDVGLDVDVEDLDVDVGGLDVDVDDVDDGGGEHQAWGPCYGDQDVDVDFVEVGDDKNNYHDDSWCLHNDMLVLGGF